MRVEKKVIPPKPQPEVVEYHIVLSEKEFMNLRDGVGSAPICSTIRPGKALTQGHCDALQNLIKSVNSLLVAGGRGFDID